jgi:hypothetical protein
MFHQKIKKVPEGTQAVLRHNPNASCHCDCAKRYSEQPQHQ